MSKKNLNKGQSMFEVLLALFIVTLIIVAIIILATNSVSNSVFSRSKTSATKLTQDAIEWIRSEREKDYSLFLDTVSTSAYCLDTLSFSNSGNCSSEEFVTNTDFLRQVNFEVVTDISGKTIIETVVVTSWTDAKGYHEARSTTNFTDIREK